MVKCCINQEYESEFLTDYGTVCRHRFNVTQITVWLRSVWFKILFPLNVFSFKCAQRKTQIIIHTKASHEYIDSLFAN